MAKQRSLSKYAQKMAKYNSETKQANNSPSSMIKSDRFFVTPEMSKSDRSELQNRVTKTRYNKKVPL